MWSRFLTFFRSPPPPLLEGREGVDADFIRLSEHVAEIIRKKKYNFYYPLISLLSGCTLVSLLLSVPLAFHIHSTESDKFEKLEDLMDYYQHHIINMTTMGNSTCNATYAVSLNHFKISEDDFCNHDDLPQACLILLKEMCNILLSLRGTGGVLGALLLLLFSSASCIATVLARCDKPLILDEFEPHEKASILLVAEVLAINIDQSEKKFLRELDDAIARETFQLQQRHIPVPHHL